MRIATLPLSGGDDPLAIRQILWQQKDRPGPVFPASTIIKHHQYIHACNPGDVTGGAPARPAFPAGSRGAMKMNFLYREAPLSEREASIRCIVHPGVKKVMVFRRFSDD